jgi:hypothetical protein
MTLSGRREGTGSALQKVGEIARKEFPDLRPRSDLFVNSLPQTTQRRSR